MPIKKRKAIGQRSSKKRKTSSHGDPLPNNSTSMHLDECHIQPVASHVQRISGNPIDTIPVLGCSTPSITMPFYGCPSSHGAPPNKTSSHGDPSPHNSVSMEVDELQIPPVAVPVPRFSATPIDTNPVPGCSTQSITAPLDGGSSLQGDPSLGNIVSMEVDECHPKPIPLQWYSAKPINTNPVPGCSTQSISAVINGGYSKSSLHGSERQPMAAVPFIKPNASGVCNEVSRVNWSWIEGSKERTTSQPCTTNTAPGFYSQTSRSNWSWIEGDEKRARHAAYMRQKRKDESLEGRQKRLLTQKIYDEERRKHESDTDKLKRQRDNARCVAERRNRETSPRRSERLKKQAVYDEQKRKNETPQQTSRRQEYARQQYHKKTRIAPIAIARNLSPGEQVEPFYLGPMTRRCEYCSALRFETESKNCCQNGKVKIADLSSPYPEELKSLLTGCHEYSKHFHENIRQYNSAFSFVSMGAQISPPPGFGPYCFRIHGQIYHRSGTLHPHDGEQPQYGQVYIMEANQAIECRMQKKENANCKEEIMKLIQKVMEEHSSFVAAYKHMYEVEKEENLRAAEENRAPTTVQMVIKRGPDRRRYNEPTHDEVAAIFVGNDGAPPANRDFIVYPKGKPCTRIKDISANCDPMVYPIFFPKGDPGWIQGEEHKGPNAKKKEDGKVHRTDVTHLQFYSYRLAIRDTFSPMHHGGKLFQQYVVDSYVHMEGNRLQYIRTKQKQLRVEMYKGLMDHLQSRAADENLIPGKVIILPSSYKGGPRAMQQNYQDAMAIVSKHGKPDLFVTYTCNPKLPEIMENLFSGQEPSDRPDIVSRVYHLHLTEFLDDILKKGILGQVKAFVRVIEFQKRGLPHCHLLLILDEDSKLRNEEDVDSIICAEIPDPEKEPELHEVVKLCMLHGPCGTDKPSRSCTENNICTKGFPKEFREETTLGDNSYPEYRRRDSGLTIRKEGVDLDNRHVVPYNPYLCKKYRSHINVEACMSVKSVKYLFKYIYKGHDCASVEVKETGELKHDEIFTHLDTRYVSPPEALWHLSAYRMHEQSHTIIRLAVHLPLEQLIYFEEGKEEKALENAKDRETSLTAWFKLNAKDEDAAKLLYPQIPGHYVFKESAWKKRKLGGGKVIGRMYSASPNDSERFHLRMLLLNVPGATSYESLRTVDGVTVQSFKEACLLRNLLEDDAEWDRAMTEAATFQMPWQLRLLFATICSHNNPSNPLQLWNDHKDSMMEDFTREFSAEDAESLTLQYIRDIVQQNRASYKDLGLPQIKELPKKEEYNVESDRKYAEEMMNILNKEQKEVVEAIFEAVREIEENQPPRCRAFFLDGVGGSGKTTVYNTVTAAMKSKGHDVDSCAWTGIAATLLRGGKTLHATFKLPVPITESSTSNISPTSRLGQRLKNVMIIIIDEASMVLKHALHAIDLLLQDITGNKGIPFGGKIVLLGGDYRQTCPIVPRGSKTAVIESTLIRSYLWPHIEKRHLIKNMRARNDQKEFAEWLLKLGNGTLKSSCSNVVPGTIDIPERCVVQGNIIDTIYQDLSKDVSKCAILTPKNDTTLELNNEILERLPGPEKVYRSIDKAITDDQDEAQTYPLEFLHSLTPSGMPEHVLRLKKGAIIMLMRNLDLKQNLCNGTRLIVAKLHSNVIEATVIKTGVRVLIPRIKLCPSDANLPFKLQRLQFPVRKAWAMTIDKSQGQEFERVGIFLPKPVFSHGQLYVAFSRGKSFNDIFVKVEDTATQGRMENGVTVTQNVVYPEVLCQQSLEEEECGNALHNVPLTPSSSATQM